MARQIDHVQAAGVIQVCISPWPNPVVMVQKDGTHHHYFSPVDITLGYWQIQMSLTSHEKTAFVTSHGLSKFRVMPFGLTNAPVVFQNTDDVACNWTQFCSWSKLGGSVYG